MEEPIGVSFSGSVIVTAVIMIIPIMLLFRGYQDSSPTRIISLIQKLPMEEKKYVIDSVLEDMRVGQECKIKGEVK